MRVEKNELKVLLNTETGESEDSIEVAFTASMVIGFHSQTCWSS